jgi:hypothetical protein
VLPVCILRNSIDCDFERGFQSPGFACRQVGVRMNSLRLIARTTCALEHTGVPRLA